MHPFTLEIILLGTIHIKKGINKINRIKDLQKTQWPCLKTLNIGSYHLNKEQNKIIEGKALTKIKMKEINKVIIESVTDRKTMEDISCVAKMEG